MADLSNVEDALVSLIGAAIYPSGPGGPSAIGAQCRVYRGWPNKTSLDSDLAAGIVNVTVFPEAGGRNTTRFPRRAGDAVITPATLTVSVAEPVVTIGGTAGVVQLVGIRTSAGAWVVPCAAIDTPATAAASLRALIPGSGGVGAAVSVSPSTGLVARVGGAGISLTETRRQVEPFRISMWCPDVTMRDATAVLVDGALAGFDWLPLADGSGGRLIYRGSFTSDNPTKDRLWRRDLRYEVEYGTTVAQTAHQMLFGTVGLSANYSAPVAYPDS